MVNMGFPERWEFNPTFFAVVVSVFVGFGTIYAKWDTIDDYIIMTDSHEKVIRNLPLEFVKISNDIKRNADRYSIAEADLQGIQDDIKAFDQKLDEQGRKVDETSADIKFIKRIIERELASPVRRREFPGTSR